jgi:dienelactone hydrolase
LQLQHLGKLLIAENLRDCIWTLDFLANHQAVDAKRLGCVGLSYGGRMTNLVAALDARIRIAAIAGAMNVFQERAMSGSTSGCQVIPGLLNYGDMPEIAGLIAPRPCVWIVGENDRLLDPIWAERFRERQQRVYTALGAGDQLHIDRFAGGHEWHGDVAYPLLKQVLRS